MWPNAWIQSECVIPDVTAIGGPYGARGRGGHKLPGVGGWGGGECPPPPDGTCNCSPNEDNNSELFPPLVLSYT